MATLLQKARGHDLRAVRAFGKDDTYLVWEGPDVVETTPDSCTCGQLNLKGNCIHMGFVRELVARDIDARNPLAIDDVPREYPPPKLPADGRTTSPYLGVTWCTVTGRWQSSIMIAGKHCRIGRFDREEDAARAYDWATYYRVDRDTRRLGRRIRYNFPGEVPQRPAGLKDDAPIMRVLDLERRHQAGTRTKRRCVALTRTA